MTKRLQKGKYLDVGIHEVEIVGVKMKELDNGNGQLLITVKCLETGRTGAYGIFVPAEGANRVLDQLLDVTGNEDGCDPEDLEGERITIEVGFKSNFYRIQSISEVEAEEEYEEEYEEDDDLLEDDEEILEEEEEEWEMEEPIDDLEDEEYDD